MRYILALFLMAIFDGYSDRYDASVCVAMDLWLSVHKLLDCLTMPVSSINLSYWWMQCREVAYFGVDKMTDNSATDHCGPASRFSIWFALSNLGADLGCWPPLTTPEPPPLRSFSPPSKAVSPLCIFTHSVSHKTQLDYFVKVGGEWNWVKPNKGCWLLSRRVFEEDEEPERKWFPHGTCEYLCPRRVPEPLFSRTSVPSNQGNQIN